MPFEIAPPVLFLRGTLQPEDTQAVAIVGTRHPTPYGNQMAERLARDLANRGLVSLQVRVQTENGAMGVSTPPCP